MYKIKILWREAVNGGKIWAGHGTIDSPAGIFSGNMVEVAFSEATTAPGPFATLVHVEAGTPFSFFLRDVTAESPIYLPACGAIVTIAEDGRNFERIVADIAAKGGKSKKQRIEEDDEYSYERAADETRDIPGPVWLGISKDMRFFSVAPRGKASGNNILVYDEIRPMFFWNKNVRKHLPELAGNEYALYMVIGRGIGCRDRLSKRLEDGYMPILNTVEVDDDVTYHVTYFATPEKSPFDAAHLRGTDMYAADASGFGNALTPAQQAYADSVMDAELSREEETVLYIRIIAENTAKAPVYGFVRMPDPSPGYYYGIPEIAIDQTVLCPETGFFSFESTGRVCVLGTLNGKPIQSVETAILIPAGGKAVFEFKIPHTPVLKERAAALSETFFEEKLAEAKVFWENELAEAARISLPEKRIEEMIKAGLLHLDMSYFGKNPDGPVVPIVGVYTAIGSESAPGIQFLDAVGMHDLAARALRYFAEKQHDDGFMQNMEGYMLETGSALWSMGEHWRLTRDERWVASVRDCVVKAANYLIRWREENMGNELKGGNGYGMIKGKVADPEDHFHSFMLNAGAYAGLRGAGELLELCDPADAERFTKAAVAMREDIRESFFHSMALAPAIPAPDGTWFRTSAVWTEGIGPNCLYAEGGTTYTHGSTIIRDVLGSNYLILQGVVDADEPAGNEILVSYSEFFTQNNVAFSQPYYSPHPYGQLLRGDVKLFLQEFYCGFAGLADRGSYSFWEHYFHGSPHKLHEEAWFLMRCRWMLVLEEHKKGVLRLLAGIPRAWLDDGQIISVEHIKTYYGDVSFNVESRVSEGKINVSLKIEDEGFPPVKILSVRIPHPTGKKAKSVTAGKYDPEMEIVLFENICGDIRFDVLF